MVDRRSLTPEERAARRERVRRRSVQAEPEIELGPPGNRYRIRDPGGGGRVAKILRSGTPYEAGVLADMASLGLTGAAVDVGANIGNHSLWLAVVCGLSVEAFEPDPANLSRLRHNVALNGL
ncbi:MAG TPA: FkbM family methyltransferase, partial [Propionibacteriaceae bacterium]|nr:FkbM family methyltransferase [Propionibacteriaceae bacterium]